MAAVVVLSGLGAGAAAAWKPEKDPGEPARSAAATTPGVVATPGTHARVGGAGTAGARVRVAEIPHLEGPRVVDLGEGIEIDLPAGFSLIEGAIAQPVLAQGGDGADNTLGVVFQLGWEWLLVIKFSSVGYVSDSDADALDADALLASYRRSTEQENRRRVAVGAAPAAIDGWIERPRYDGASHQLVWGLQGHSSADPISNLFTAVLGRRGYLTLNLIDSSAAIEESRRQAAPALAAIRFVSGARYEDHREGDRASGQGLRTLISGVSGGADGSAVAMPKVGEPRLMVGILLVLKEGYWLIGVALVGLVWWLLRRESLE